ncbi:MAG: hypothetical protein NDI69_14575 [Bacteriovoracaceae bacterium]|nr:hypothetical protein [Bacteriovoracaceae bacterium]
MKNISLKIVSSLALFSLAISCGDSGNSSKPTGSTQVGDQETQEEEVIPLDGSNIDGTYTAKFITLNSHVNGTIPGSATFMRKEDKWFAYIRLFAGMPKAWHMQNVYEGTRCPTANDDLNLDGFIDIIEAQAVLGKILIPLDSDISTQNSGRAFFPLADLSGSYHYERITSFSRFFQDLKAEDKNPEDHVTKLAPDQGLKLVGKAVMIQGIAEDVELPETVQTLERRRPFQTLPIVCGIYEKVEATPGEAYSEEIPGPVADVIEGQDQPAPAEDGQGETTGETGGSTTGETNDSDDGDGPVSDGEGRTSGGTTGGTSGDDEEESETTTGGSSSGGNSGGETTGDSDEEETSSTTGTTTGGFLDTRRSGI